MQDKSDQSPGGAQRARQKKPIHSNERQKVALVVAFPLLPVETAVRVERDRTRRADPPSPIKLGKETLGSSPPSTLASECSLLGGAIISRAGIGTAELSTACAWLADDVAFVRGVGRVGRRAADEFRWWTLCACPRYIVVFSYCAVR